jgi:ABC-type multidrug transport system ATPase subunit
MEKFSGGNQQKAVLARWLRTDPLVLLLDEPTQGVDVGAKAAIYSQIAEAAREGVGVLIASSDADELVHLCDRVLVMRSGTVGIELEGSSLTTERVVAETLGATSHRKQAKTHREPIMFKVIRDDDDVEVVETHVVADAPATPAAPPARGGRFARLVRTARARMTRGGS